MIRKISIRSSSETETMKLAAGIGTKLRGGETIELSSDLGGGKTTFVKGLAEGAGSNELVTSPSFTLQNEYLAKSFTLHHLDFYRLKDPGIMKQMLEETLNQSGGVVVIEWAEIVEDILPAISLKLAIKTTSETTRQFEISLPSELNYLLES
jgi:tRNA threonylcarbamoyladenosine biosynthesis protein TsaE